MAQDIVRYVLAVFPSSILFWLVCKEGGLLMVRKCSIVLLLLLLCGCTNVSAPYSFPNKHEPIMSVELLHNMNPGGKGTDENNMELLRSLEEEEIIQFMNALYSLPTERQGIPPSWGYGEYVTKVRYQNGDIEIYGPLTFVLIPSGSAADRNGIGEYHFTGNGYTKLFAEYIDIEALPEPPEGYS